MVGVRDGIKVRFLHTVMRCLYSLPRSLPWRCYPTAVFVSNRFESSRNDKLLSTSARQTKRETIVVLQTLML